MNNEIRMHIFGLNRLEISGDTELEDKRSIRLSKEITKICRESGLTYQEIQKAIVYADNSLYCRVRVNDNDGSKD